jgi:hypothetical protein
MSATNVKAATEIGGYVYGNNNTVRLNGIEVDVYTACDNQLQRATTYNGIYGDGHIDQNDFAVWKTAFVNGTSISGCNAPVDLVLFNVWRRELAGY